MLTFEIFLSVLTYLLKDRYSAFVYYCISWTAPWWWNILEELQDYWSDDISDTESDVSNGEEW